ncbi:MAG: heavy metal-binding domain-containing protein, partial [Sediminibacterium sp.]|nr:heavy metal-binding domain-containing protein [Sediminibacterium sp.]
MRYTLFIAIALVLVSSCKTKTKNLNALVIPSDIYYTCSMDPQVREYKPGKCPICKMELTPVKKTNGEKDDEVELSDQQIQLGN